MPLPSSPTNSPALRSRRQFLGGLSAAWLGTHALAQTPARPKAPFRLLYSNDLTNILSCTSPFHRAREPFRREMLEATVDEVAGKGVDVHLLQPGLGSVPLWPSKVYPLAEHAAWLKERYGLKLDPFTQFTLEGGDLVRTFIDRCRARGQSPFISFRLNDAHHKETADKKKGEKMSGSAAMALTKFYCEHPEYRIVPGSTSAKDIVLNWAIPEVRAEKFALIQELCENYDFAGLELDFLRFYSFFRLNETTREQRCLIITAFVADVRAVLNRTGAKSGTHRWLGIRIPCYREALDILGLDLPALVTAGVDIVNASAHYFTTQQHDLGFIRKQVPASAALHFEMCHSTWNGPKLQAGYDVFPFRRTTREQYETTAHQAYTLGADGMSLFNFAYYREHGSGERGPFSEPPFDVLPALRDPAALAQRPQHWFLAPGWRAPGAKPTMVPRNIEPGKPAEFALELAPPTGGWRQGGRLRLQGEAALTAGVWKAMLNGLELSPTEDRREPYPNPYPGLLGLPEQLLAWSVPATALRPGRNVIRLVLDGGSAATVNFVDLSAS